MSSTSQKNLRRCPFQRILTDLLSYTLTAKMVKTKNTEDMNGTGYEWEYAKKIDNRTTGQKIANFIFNPETHAILGRTVKSWGALLLFYAIFYSVLALLFAICMKVLMLTLTTEYPKWQLQESIIGTNPGLGFRPMANDTEASSVIWFRDKNKDSWVSAVQNFLKNNYKEDKSAFGIVCDKNRKPDYEKNEYCKVNVEDGSFQECSEKTGYGYYKSQPCVFIKLNRIYNWIPQYYNTTESLHKDIPIHTRTAIIDAMKQNPNQVWVSCDGQSPHDREHQGEIRYYPSPGFPDYFYPYLNSKAYQSPLVAVQFLSPKPNVLINIECRAWAKNIVYKANSQQREGSVHFEIQFDE